MNLDNMTDLQKDISDLELKYMTILHNIFSSQKFLNSMKRIESRIIADYTNLQDIWQIKNKIAIALERITRFYIYKHNFSTDVYHSPISSDIAFYTDDALICLDTKTIDLNGNAGDEKWIQFERNQVNIKNKVKNPMPPFKGVHYHECLPTIDKLTDKPVLTFFICVIYEDNSKDFNLRRMSLACIPNGELSNLYEFDLISNYKTYNYITSTHAKNFVKNGLNGLQPIKNIQSHWLDLNNGSYYDDSVFHPNHADEHVVRRLLGGDYKVVISGNTARIDPNKISTRIDSSGKTWQGYQKWNI